MSELFEIFLSEPGCILTEPFFYTTLILLFTFLTIWLTRLNAALTKYDPLFIIPLLQSNYILFSTLTGGVFFQEFSQVAAPIRSIRAAASVVVVFVGVAMPRWCVIIGDDASRESSQAAHSQSQSEASRDVRHIPSGAGRGLRLFLPRTDPPPLLPATLRPPTSSPPPPSYTV